MLHVTAVISMIFSPFQAVNVTLTLEWKEQKHSLEWDWSDANVSSAILHSKSARSECVNRKNILLIVFSQLQQLTFNIESNSD